MRYLLIAVVIVGFFFGILFLAHAGQTEEQLMDMLSELHIRHDIEPLEQWEIDAIIIIMSGARGKNFTDIVRTDCGAHGFAHFQPPNGLGIEELEHYEEMDVDCWFYHDDWRGSITEILYSPDSWAIQVEAWRRNAHRAARSAKRSGWGGVELAVAASIANSTGAAGFRRLARRASWCVEGVIDEYLEQRPNSGHRARRAERMRALLENS